MKKYLFLGTLSLFLLTACGEEDTSPKKEEEPTSEVTDTTDETKSSSTENSNDVSWTDKITSLATNSDPASDKFYALEKMLMEYDATDDEVKEFSNDIINDYKSGNYLSELENHERMLTNIFKSYYVEKNSEGALKDFAFDYLQNMKYTYRGAESVDSDSVKSNEEQMNKALKEIK